MPIGKNAIKRVTNNSTTATKTQEVQPQSAVAEEKKVGVKKAKPQATNTTPKEAPKKMVKATATPKKSLEREPDLSPVKTAEKVTKKSTKSETRQGDGYVNLGGELPYYLL